MLTHNVKAVTADLNTIPSKVKANIQASLQLALVNLKAALIDTTPVWRGQAAASWHIDPPVFEGDEVIGSVFNSAKHSRVLEYGSPKGGRPWGKAGERTEESEGRIWSSQARGGFMKEVVNDAYEKALIKSITENILAGI